MTNVLMQNMDKVEVSDLGVTEFCEFVGSPLITSAAQNATRRSTRNSGRGSTSRTPGDEPATAAENSSKRHRHHHHGHHSSTLFLAYSTLGVIYGDIGTSPLYAFSSIFTSPPESEEEVMGALSCMIWTLLMVVVIKYVLFVLLADDKGNGGTFAIFARVRRDLQNDSTLVQSPTIRRWIIDYSPYLSSIGVAGILSDGILTPAISVLGAVQGIKVVDPSLPQSAVVGITIVIIVVLYFIQHFGTGQVSKLFSPVIMVWFIALAIIGGISIRKHPGVLRSFGPDLAFKFFITHKRRGWEALGAIFLTVTGAEALFADLGHFNRAAIRVSAMTVVIPCLLICYCGQAAELIIDPSIYTNVFFLGMPSKAQIPMIVLATVAAIIASQAIISATFSLLTQSMAMDFFPRLTVKHTDRDMEGRVYIPEVNYTYMVLVIAVVAGFRNTTSLGNAYGIAVCIDMITTDILFSLAIIISLRGSVVSMVVFFLVFMLIDVSFLSANLLKFISGGWFTVAVLIIVFVAMTVWRMGRLQMLQIQMEGLGSLTTQAAAIDERQSISNRCGTVICYAKNITTVPPIYAHVARNLKIVPELLILLHLKGVSSPYCQDNATMCQFSPRIFLIVIEYGYTDEVPDFPHIRRVINNALMYKNVSIEGEVKTKREREREREKSHSYILLLALTHSLTRTLTRV